MISGTLKNGLFGLLVILNLGLLGWIVWRETHPPLAEQRPPERIIAQQLNLDEDQKTAFRQKRQAHFQHIHPIVQALMEDKRKLIAIATAPQIDSAQLNRVLDDISIHQRQIDAQLVDHLRDLKSVCRPDQQQDLERYFLRIIMNQSSGRRQGGPPGRNRE